MVNNFVVQAYNVHPEGKERPLVPSKEFDDWLAETETVYAAPVTRLWERQEDFLLGLAIKKKQEREDPDFREVGE
jgi:hypothetical protein